MAERSIARVVLPTHTHSCTLFHCAHSSLSFVWFAISRYVRKFACFRDPFFPHTYTHSRIPTLIPYFIYHTARTLQHISDSD